MMDILLMTIHLSHISNSWATEHYHLWTIADAKEGDVLFMDNGSANCIFIYKSSNNGIINKYASYNNFGFEGEHYLVLNDGYVIPATKEQRDLLFQKMHEAAYEWDAEKKELKKIHIIDEGKAEMDYCFSKMMNGEKVSPAWSEEDEKVLKDILVDVKFEGYNNDMLANSYKKINWLKSLRQRIGG